MIPLLCQRDSYGEDITEQGSDESVDFDSEEDYDEDFIDDGDVEVFPPSPKTNSGGVFLCFKINIWLNKL